MRVVGAVIAGFVAAAGWSGCVSPPDAAPPPDEPEAEWIALPAGAEAGISAGDAVVCWDPEDAGPLLSFTESAQAPCVIG